MPVIQVGENEYKVIDVKGVPKGMQSLPNAYTAMALDAAGWTYEFRASFFDPGLPRRGLEIDFMIFTRPLVTYLFVDGGWFHNAPGTRERDNFERQLLYARTRTYAKEPVAVTSDLVATFDLALAWVLKEIGRA